MQLNVCCRIRKNDKVLTEMRTLYNHAAFHLYQESSGATTPRNLFLEHAVKLVTYLAARKEIRM